jgi:hypothetical protein
MHYRSVVIRTVSVFLLGSGVLIGCSTTSDDEDAGVASDAGAEIDAGDADTMECIVAAPTRCPDPAPRYADVEPIFAERCVTCHSGVSGGPWPLVSYGHVAAWFAEIRGAMLSCSMPPPDAGVPMTVEERELILAWIRCDLPQ